MYNVDHRSADLWREIELGRNTFAPCYVGLNLTMPVLGNVVDIGGADPLDRWSAMNVSVGADYRSVPVK
ncbi:hypothetical protein NUU61_005732 [Penicillium alfredii]|uniref:Uncharacterized protein n=1 Tax=Penicillium alfredii TaxID=1506179 RepID=A0A9W9K8H1_9EURO|nr:uncharacterized protein NUU61_005732 [Penicillium alfredii]KAJ5096376.1 hypothetical protein NUU61_005732 [Penicillium alfredii]